MDLDKIIEINKGLIYKIMQNFYGIEQSDLYQAGVLGLIKAYKEYQTDKNTKFSTYAYKYIFGEMYQLKIKSQALKQNRDLISWIKKVNIAKDKLSQIYGKDPSISELSTFLEIDENTLSEIINGSYTVLSIDYQTNEKDPIIDTISDDDTLTFTGKIAVDDCLNALTEEEKEIIKYRYYEDYTQQETADRLGLSQVKVSRYEKRSLTKMKNYLAA